MGDPPSPSLASALRSKKGMRKEGNCSRRFGGGRGSGDLLLPGHWGLSWEWWPSLLPGSCGRVSIYCVFRKGRGLGCLPGFKSQDGKYLKNKFSELQTLNCHSARIMAGLPSGL